MSSLVGKYAFDRSENLDEYLINLGVGRIVRKIQSVSRPKLQILYDKASDQWRMILASVFHNYQVQFRLGHTIDHDETFDVRPCRTLVKLAKDGSGAFIMHQTPKDRSSKVVTIIDKLPNGGVKFEMESFDRKATIYYKPYSDPNAQSSATGTRKKIAGTGKQSKSDAKAKSSKSKGEA